MQPPDFSRGDWWIELILQLITLWLLSRTRAEVRLNGRPRADDTHPRTDSDRR